MTSDLRTNFIEAMSRATTFVAVATTAGEEGAFGVTISSVTSVSADGAHPSLLACIHHNSSTAAAILKNRKFCINLLGEDQSELAGIFAGRQGLASHESRFAAAPHQIGAFGQPMLDGASAVFDCSLATGLLWESHYVMIGHVHKVHLSDQPCALLYGHRKFLRADRSEG